MLFGYPLVAIENNWLHECLYDIIQSIHTSLNLAEIPPKWPEIIPEMYRDRLRKHRGVKDRLKNYQKAIERLPGVERDRVLQALTDQNEIALLLCGAHDCETISHLPQVVHEPVKDLFTFAFELLTDFRVRDHHYQIIYYAIPSHVCPFCGCEFFHPPGTPREPYDHYLPKSKYPFAAANLRNLVPMGPRCNSCYKDAQDILWCDNGTRRRSFDPYGDVKIQISLENSQPFGGVDEQIPHWQVDFLPDMPEVVTWDEVFSIRQRYVGDVLNPYYGEWLKMFGKWFKKYKGDAPVSDDDLVNALEQYVDQLYILNLTGRDFLRKYVFEMLHNHCKRGDPRLLDLIKDVITYAVV